MRYRAFNKQIEFHKSWQDYRLRGIFTGKRGGKTEAGAVEAIAFTHEQRNYKKDPKKGIEPYKGCIVSPTNDMLHRVSLDKFFRYAKPFKFEFHKAPPVTITWENGSIIYPISAEKPQRIEGLRLHWAWVDEVFQCPEQVYDELKARLTDTKGYLWLTGSLGTQYNNPKAHWIYRRLIEEPPSNAKVFQWTTADNPYIPEEELLAQKDELDPRTYRQLYCIDWNVPGTGLVYDDFSEANVLEDIPYNPDLETSVCVDWGWAHDMAALFFQYDPKKDVIYLFDEIVRNKILLDDLWKEITKRNYKITNWYCDIAGNQEREQTGRSNVAYFRENFQVQFKYRKMAVQPGISLVRSYIKNGKGQQKFLISRRKCPKSIDSISNYNYPQKNGIILNEVPLKQDGDDCVDCIRYFCMNRLDKKLQQPIFSELSRWDNW